MNKMEIAAMELMAETKPLNQIAVVISSFFPGKSKIWFQNETQNFDIKKNKERQHQAYSGPGITQFYQNFSSEKMENLVSPALVKVSLQFSETMFTMN